MNRALSQLSQLSHPHYSWSKQRKRNALDPSPGAPPYRRSALILYRQVLDGIKTQLPPPPVPPYRRSALILYRQILDGIEANGYNNFTQRAYVPKLRKLASLPLALMAAQMPQSVTEAHAAKLLQQQ